MKTSAAGRALIEQREGRRLAAYRDTRGILTIGVGHTGRMSPPAVTSGMRITAAQCDAMLATDLAPVEAVINGAVTVAMTQNEFDAMASLGFNIGAGGLKTSSVVRFLNAGDKQAAANAFLLWQHPAVLRGRRVAERHQFLTADGTAALYSASDRKALVHPVTGRVLKLGRRQPAFHSPRLRLSRYVNLAGLPPIPETFDFSAPAHACLAQSLLNDNLSDCTAAGAFHLLGIFLAQAGRPTTWADDQVELFYRLTTGYDGTPETDNGGDEVTVLNYWRDHGVDGKGAHRIAGHMTVDATNPAEIRAALFLFFNVYFGMSLPNEWVAKMPEKDGFVWDAAGDPDPDNGHCFVGIAGATRDGVIINSWGLRGLITWRAIAKYGVGAAGGEIRTVISPECFAAATAKAPNGLDHDAMVADFQRMGGKIAA